MIRGRLVGVLCLLFAVTASDLVAQPLGTFTWQLQPYCNVLTVNVTQDGAVYTLDGYDNQCGAGQSASAVGMAFFNPDGSVGIGTTIVMAPGGAPVHVDATISVATLSGTWRDSSGNTGPFVFTSGAPAPGSPRPTPAAGVADGSITASKLAPNAVDTTKILDGTIAAVDIDAAQVQRRVTGACAGGELMTGVNTDGTVACGPGGSGGSGDITGVLAGAGLTGGGTSGTVTLNVSFGGTGVATSAARSDHTHEIDTGQANTGVGIEALVASTSGANNTAVGFRALDEMTTASFNTAVGASALGKNTTGGLNTGVGYLALSETTTGESNTAVGYAALSSNLIGDYNTAVGTRTLDTNTTGEENTAVGRNALAQNTEGDTNTAVGARALDSSTTGSGNVAIGASALQANTIGEFNVAVGSALSNVTTGSGNIGIGNGAGALITTGSDNIFVGGAAASVSESSTTRIGGVNQTRAFMAGIRNITTGQNNAVAVLVDSSGQLGTVSSTRRVKEDVAALGGVGQKLQQLRPVRFRYIEPFADGSKPVQYGLIAEEVAEVLPELVARSADGTVETVLYHVLPSLLIEEVQRLQRELDELRRLVRTELAHASGSRR